MDNHDTVAEKSQTTLGSSVTSSRPSGGDGGSESTAARPEARRRSVYGAQERSAAKRSSHLRQTLIRHMMTAWLRLSRQAHGRGVKLWSLVRCWKWCYRKKKEPEWWLESKVVFELMCARQEGMTKREVDLKETGAKSPLAISKETRTHLLLESFIKNR